jgi:chaperone required for assembly of F1-ATPase
VFEILLDGRPVKTPGRNVLRLPTRALAESIAAEWAAQGETVDPVSMPHLRLANAVLDGIAASRDEVVAGILRFGEHDALCYCAEHPPELVRRQRDAWDPLLAWAAQRYGARLNATAGLVHIDQPPESLAALRKAVAAQDDFALAALHMIASITGSLVLALAVAEGRIDAAQAFALSRIDEDYQAEKWGLDAEAQARAQRLARELGEAAAFIAAARA